LAWAGGFVARLVLAVTAPAVLGSQLGQWLAPQMAAGVKATDWGLVGALLGIAAGEMMGLLLLRRSLDRQGLGAWAADLALCSMAVALVVRTAVGLVRPLALEEVAVAYAWVLAAAAVITLICEFAGRRGRGRAA